MPTRPGLVLLSLALGAAALTTASPAVARDEPERRVGTCTASSDWKFKVTEDAGRLYVSATLDSGVGDQVWDWTLLHNGEVSDEGRRSTRDDEGYFRVNRTMIDLPGTDDVGFRATQPRTGETCRARILF